MGSPSPTEKHLSLSPLFVGRKELLFRLFLSDQRAENILQSCWKGVCHLIGTVYHLMLLSAYNLQNVETTEFDEPRQVVTAAWSSAEVEH